jgi:dienelactone hydrolase
LEGADAQVDTMHGPYPIVAFGHGFLMQTGYYTSLFRHLATHGFVVIAPQFPDVVAGELAADLLYCIQHLRELNSSQGSKFFGLLDTGSVGLSGHSMGGGASLLAAAQDPRVLVVAPLAAAEVTSSVIGIMPQIRGTVYLIAASADAITPPASNQIPMYNNANSPKALVTIREGNHIRFIDVASFDAFEPYGTLTRTEQLMITRRYVTSIFSFVLKHDASYRVYAWGDSAAHDPRITFSMMWSATGTSMDVSPVGFSLGQNYPNPFNPATTIHYQLPMDHHVIIKVYDLLGREVALLVDERKQPGTYEVQFDGSGLSSGAYLCRLMAGTNVLSRRMLLLR